MTTLKRTLPAQSRRNSRYRHSVNGIYILAEYAGQHGVAVRDLLSGTGLDPADLLDPMLRVSREQEDFFFRNLVNHLRDPFLGLAIGSRYRVSAFGTLGMAMLSSRNLRAVFDMVLRHYEHGYASLDYELKETPRGVVVAMRDHAPLHAPRRFVHDRHLSGSWQLFSDVLGRTLPLREVHCAYRRPPSSERYVRHFGCPVIFGRRESRLVFDAEWLDYPLPQANPLTAAIFEEQLEAALATEQDGAFAKRVADLLRARPGPRLNMAAVAAHFRTTPRTMLRRLRAEGVTYRSIAREVRHDLARHYLDNTSRTLSEIAPVLGFSDASSLSHAYRTWTGNSPGSLRRQRR